METTQEIIRTGNYIIGILRNKETSQPIGMVLGDVAKREAKSFYRLPFIEETVKGLEPLTKEVEAQEGEIQRSVSYGELVELQEGFLPYAEKYHLQEGTEEYSEALNDYELEFINSSESEFPTVQEFIKGYKWELKG